MNQKNPKKVNCFKCYKDFLIRWVIPKQDYSQKNNWGYWTEKKENQDKYICDNCLKDLYLNHKEQYWKLIKGDMKRQTIRNYVYNRQI
ncbi:MAG: hypothetical protein MRERV_37c014 [Mycoplasmataceae bacterium RV_VA103A]|nr:MAG: hypothetical protein MRERV_37c014 [Mycoplasmataceae bacterium RV_VA103A]